MTARAGRSGTRFLRDLAVVIVVALLASFLIKTFLVRSFFIPSQSMERTLLGDPGHHDRILVDELVPSLVPLRHGDVIVFVDPGGWLPPSTAGTSRPQPLVAAGAWVLSLTGLSTDDANDHLVKRVIGLPGDRVACCDAQGRITVNGAPLDEPYVHRSPGETAVSADPFHVTVPHGRLWVMGDNRDESADSRYHGTVPIGDVTGRAFVLSWPISRWSYLSDFPDTFAGVPAPAEKGP